jgi:hypothetical protein
MFSYIQIRATLGWGRLCKVMLSCVSIKATLG